MLLKIKRTSAQSLSLKTSHISTITLFSNCTYLVNVYLANVSSIDSYAFSSCTSLAQITLSDTINIKGEHAFDGAGLTNINLKNISIVREHAFANCSSLRSVDFSLSGIT
ncbi:MAG: leucine-rich repeat protein [Candidatus Enterosoma sp.]|nr:leucine-rich repeat protein [bacterium]MDY5866358.1 leucine-rich repeat protein [Candidatus Enterosoma sp.]